MPRNLAHGRILRLLIGQILKGEGVVSDPSTEGS